MIIEANIEKLNPDSSLKNTRTIPIEGFEAEKQTRINFRTNTENSAENGNLIPEVWRRQSGESASPLHSSGL